MILYVQIVKIFLKNNERKIKTQRRLLVVIRDSPLEQFYFYVVRQTSLRCPNDVSGENKVKLSINVFSDKEVLFSF